jgi:integrase/transposase-like protein
MSKSEPTDKTVSIQKLEKQINICPECGSSQNVVCNSHRDLKDGQDVQRFICKSCKYRFSNRHSNSNSVASLKSNRKICADGAKNLHVLPYRRHVGTGEVTAEHLALLRVFEGWLRKEGYNKNCYPNNVKTLLYLGANLLDPEDVKAKIADHNVKNGMKMQLCYSYEAFLRMNKMTWTRPKNGEGYKQDEIIPFIPEETELDQLIAAAHSKRMSVFLETLKETFTDPGEALQIERNDIVGNFVTIRHPVKNHRPRTLEVHPKLIAMLKTLPYDSERIFDCKYSTMISGFTTLRSRVAQRTQNDRINYIELRSYRHWAGTMIAEMSNGNPMTVMKLLGLKCVDNAMKYVNIWKLSFKTETEWQYLEVTTPDELKIALLGGYVHVIDKFGASWFRRPKRIAIAGTPISQRPDELQCPPLETPINKREPANKNAY